MEEIQNTGNGLIKIRPIDTSSTASPSAPVEVVTEAPTTVEVTTEAATTAEVVTEAATTVQAVTEVASTVEAVTTGEVLEPIAPHSEKGYGEEAVASDHESASIPEEPETEPQAPGYGPESVLTAERTTKAAEQVVTDAPITGGEYKIFGEKSNVQPPIEPPGNPETSNLAFASASGKSIFVEKRISRKLVALSDNFVDRS